MKQQVLFNCLLQEGTKHSNDCEMGCGASKPAPTLAETKAPEAPPPAETKVPETPLLAEAKAPESPPPAETKAPKPPSPSEAEVLKPPPPAEAEAPKPSPLEAPVPPAAGADDVAKVAMDVVEEAIKGAIDSQAVDGGGDAPKDSAPANVTLRIFHLNDVYKMDNLPALKTCIDRMSAGVDKTLKVPTRHDYSASTRPPTPRSRDPACSSTVPFKRKCISNPE